jgi:hypothetical protein
MVEDGWPISKWAQAKIWKFEDDRIPKTLMKAVTDRGVALPSLDKFNVFSLGGAILTNAGQLASNAGELTKGGLQSLAKMKNTVGPLFEDELKKMVKRWEHPRLTPSSCFLAVLNIFLVTCVQSGARASGSEA